MSQKHIENRALLVTILVNTIITISGIWMYFITDLKIMFLDGFYSLVALLSSIVALLISKFSRKTAKYYPHGLYFLEPLYAMFKSFIIIVLIIYALITTSQVAYNYFIYGEGKIMETAPIPAYAFAMTILCLGLAFFNHKQYKKTNSTSTMLRAESQTNMIDGLQSAGIGVAIIILQIIPLNSTFGFLHYTGDFFIAVILVATSFKDPIILFFDSFRELTGGTAKDKKIYEAVEQSTGLPSTDFSVYKIGMKIKVCIPMQNIKHTDKITKEKMLQNLRIQYECADIEYTV